MSEAEGRAQSPYLSLIVSEDNDSTPNASGSFED